MRKADVVEVKRGGVIEVPNELARLLEFWEGTQVSPYLIESRYYNSQSVECYQYSLWVAQLLIPVDRILNEIYRIEYALGDEPGSFATFCDLLKELGVRLQIGESRTTICNIRAEATELCWFEFFDGDVDALNENINRRINSDKSGDYRKKIKPISYEIKFKFTNLPATPEKKIGFVILEEIASRGILKDVEEILQKYLFFSDQNIMWKSNPPFIVTRFKSFFKGPIHDINELKSLLIQEIEERIKEKAMIDIIDIKEVWTAGQKASLSELPKEIYYPSGSSKGIGVDRPLPFLKDEGGIQVLENAAEGNVRFRLPVDTLDDYLKECGWLDSKESIGNGGKAVLLIADTAFPALKITFPPRDAVVRKLVLGMNDSSTALSDCAKFLEAKNINLLESELNTIQFRRKKEWRIIADYGISEYRNFSQARLEKELKKDIEILRIKHSLRVKTKKEIGKIVPSDGKLFLDGKIFITNQRPDAEKFLSKWFPRMEGGIIGILPYIDSSTFTYLNGIRKKCKIRIITSFIKKEEDSKAIAKVLAGGRPQSGLEIKILTYTGPGETNEEEIKTPLHSRWLRSENIYIDLGTDLKQGSFDKRVFQINVFSCQSFEDQRKYFEILWSSPQKKLRNIFDIKTFKKEDWNYRST